MARHENLRSGVDGGSGFTEEKETTVLVIVGVYEFESKSKSVV